MTRKSNPQVRQALELVSRISPILAGRDPQVIGAALAELTATLLLSHDPRIRLLLLQVHYRAVEKMLREYPDPFSDGGNGNDRMQ